VKPTRQRKLDKGAKVGAIVGSVSAAIIFAVIGRVIFVWYRRRWARSKSVLPSSSPPTFLGPYSLHTIEPLNENPDAEMVASRRLSPSPPAIVPLPQLAEPGPVGLSETVMAWLRRQNSGSQQPQTRSTLDASQSQAEASTSPANAATGPGEASSSYDGLHSEVESLRREVERLRAELVAEVPPPLPSHHTDRGPSGSVHVT
jgi:hypothetical protein